MTLPDFNEAGDLPAGIHRAQMADVIARFGGGSVKRVLVTERLRHIYALATRTELLTRFIVFGSYVTSKPEPNDVDVVMVMDNAFSLKICPSECLGLFDHPTAQARYGASIFWVRPNALIGGETVEEFIAYWQIKRDKTMRGILEIEPSE